MEEDKLQDKQEFSWVRTAHIGVSLLVIAGLLYFSGIYQATFYQRTPTDVTEETRESVVDAEIVTVPLTVFILSNDKSGGSGRLEEDARRIVSNASKIWEAAAIDLKIKNIYRPRVSDEEIRVFYSSPNQFVSNFELFDPETINVFLVGHLGGANGIAFLGIRSIAVADYTSVYDFRALAHEVGHILGLSHVSRDQNRLMYRGANGTSLTLEEIMVARESALRF